jgi:hypothetical protein
MHNFALITYSHSPPFVTNPHLTNNNLALLREIVRRNLQVQRRRSLSYTAGDIVVRAVARAEPASKVTSLANGDTTQVRADTQHDEPFGLLDAVLVGLGVAQGFPLGVFGFFDLGLGAVADEDGLASPFDNDLVGVSQHLRCWVICGGTYVLALGDGGEVNLDLGLGEDVGGCGHVDEEVWCAEC